MTPTSHRASRGRIRPLIIIIGAAVALALGAAALSKQRSPQGPIPIPVISESPGATPGPSVNIYSAAGAGMLSPAVEGMPSRVYVPQSAGFGIYVIDPSNFEVLAKYRTGLNPQHVVPAWDLKTLYVTNDLGNSLTPIDPFTAKPAGPNIPVADPYNMYFQPDGKAAIVVAEAQQHLDFRDPHDFSLLKEVPVTCPGVDHMDFSADETFLVATCEFSARLVKVDLRTRQVDGYLNLPGSSPQDIKLDALGRIFYVADRNRGGVYLIDADTFRKIGFIQTGKDTHGLYPSRDARFLYVTNRGSGSITVIDFATRKIVVTWKIEGAHSPDMGGVSADGKVLWVSGRYDAAVYAISTYDGHLLAKIRVPGEPHGLSIWPQPGRFSLGHTGVTR